MVIARNHREIPESIEARLETRLTEEAETVAGWQEA
jgi:hypothetical protein